MDTYIFSLHLELSIVSKMLHDLSRYTVNSHNSICQNGHDPMQIEEEFIKLDAYIKSKKEDIDIMLNELSRIKYCMFSKREQQTKSDETHPIGNF